MVGVECGRGWVGWGGNDTVNVYTNDKRVHNKSEPEILTGDDVPVIS